MSDLTLNLGSAVCLRQLHLYFVGERRKREAAGQPRHLSGAVVDVVEAEVDDSEDESISVSAEESSTS